MYRCRVTRRERGRDVVRPRGLEPHDDRARAGRVDVAGLVGEREDAGLVDRRRHRPGARLEMEALRAVPGQPLAAQRERGERRLVPGPRALAQRLVGAIAPVALDPLLLEEEPLGPGLGAELRRRAAAVGHPALERSHYGA